MGGCARTLRGWRAQWRRELGQLAVGMAGMLSQALWTRRSLTPKTCPALLRPDETSWPDYLWLRVRHLPGGQGWEYPPSGELGAVAPN